MSKVSPCLWFDGVAEEAANFYVSLVPGSHINEVFLTPVETESGPLGSVLVVDFTLAGETFMALNGGRYFTLSPAISFKIDCEDQAEVDRLWDALSADGGVPGRCGWLVDRFGVSWQIIPKVLMRMISDPTRAARVMTALMAMDKIDIAALEAA